MKKGQRITNKMIAERMVRDSLPAWFAYSNLRGEAGAGGGSNYLPLNRQEKIESIALGLKDKE